MKIVKKIAVVIMMMSIIFSSPAIAFAAETASNLTELAEIVSRHGVERDTSLFTVKYTGDESDMDRVINKDFLFFYSDLAVLWDDPNTSDDADYLIGNLDFSTDEHEIEFDGDKLTLKFRYLESKSQTNKVNSKVPEILDQLGVESMSNYDKVKTIHDYVCKQFSYHSSEEDIVYTMYGGLFNRKAVCNGYALCMYKLLVEAGVPCKYITGEAGTGIDKDAHAWNIVALGDKWYYLDSTWDDADDMLSYDYFLKGSSDFDETDPSEKHAMFPPYKKAPFSKAFPIAKNSFNPKLMDDKNTTVTIGSWTGDYDSDEPEEEYKLSDLVEYKDPSSGKFTVKKKKSKYLLLYLKKGAEDLVSKVSYKVTKGKSYIKSIKNYGLIEDEEDGPFTYLTFKGKKKGKVNIKIILKLTNGQSLSYTFKGKVK